MVSNALETFVGKLAKKNHKVKLKEDSGAEESDTEIEEKQDSEDAEAKLKRRTQEVSQQRRITKRNWVKTLGERKVELEVKQVSAVAEAKSKKNQRSKMEKLYHEAGIGNVNVIVEMDHEQDVHDPSMSHARGSEVKEQIQKPETVVDLPEGFGPKDVKQYSKGRSRRQRPAQ